MESFRIDGNSVHDYAIEVHEAPDVTPEVVRTLVEIDLQTFAESTYNQFTAAAFLKMGRVFLLQADGLTIGTCVCFRSWERPNEVMLLSMGIRPGWRGRGLGQRFVRGVMERLKSKGIRSVSLMVGKDNRRAIKVYSDVGFQSVGEREVDPENGDTLVIMRAVLREDPDLVAL